MKKLFFIFALISLVHTSEGQMPTEPDFSWGNSNYYNLYVGDTIWYNGVGVVLLQMKNHYNTLKVGNDTIELKVSRRSLPASMLNIRIFVADNRNVKSLTANAAVHGLLKKDVLICLSDISANMLPFGSFTFPVSYNDGFNWIMNEDNHFFSYQFTETKEYSNQGIGIALPGVRQQEKHWLVAMESSTVVWIEEDNPDQQDQEASVLLQSHSDSQLYYVYDHLNKNTLEIKENQKVMNGELIGTSWGDEEWEYVQLAVVKSDTIPLYENRYANCVNFFPQLHELYFKNSYIFSKNFTRGKIEFAQPPATNGNQKNILAFEEYVGMGWILGKWNVTDKVMFKTKGEDGNARLKKVLFSETKAESRNPDNYFEYEINVRNGVYRVRAEVGDVDVSSWQRLEFEGIEDATYELSAGELKWTGERIVSVNDSRLTIRIYIDPTNQKIAGISQIVFQQAY